MTFPKLLELVFSLRYFETYLFVFVNLLNWIANALEILDCHVAYDILFTYVLCIFLLQ